MFRSSEVREVTKDNLRILPVFQPVFCVAAKGEYGTICTSCRASNTNCLILLSGLRIMRRLFPVTSLTKK